MICQRELKMQISKQEISEIDGSLYIYLIKNGTKECLSSFDLESGRKKCKELLLDEDVSYIMLRGPEGIDLEFKK